MAGDSIICYWKLISYGYKVAHILEGYLYICLCYGKIYKSKMWLIFIPNHVFRTQLVIVVCQLKPAELSEILVSIVILRGNLDSYE